MGILKRCRKCDTVKLVTEFPKNRRQCKACIAVYSHRHYVESGLQEALRRPRKKSSREELLVRRRARYAANREAIRVKRSAYYAATSDRQRAKSAAYQKTNPGTVNAYNRARRAAKLRRTPPWSDLKYIRAIYEACPPGHHVDHIVPLQGKSVSGLHVANNLQYLPEAENKRKYNMYQPTVEVF